MKLIANTDEKGNIIQAVYGNGVVDPDGNYHYHLESSLEVVENIDDYIIKNGELQKKANENLKG